MSGRRFAVALLVVLFAIACGFRVARGAVPERDARAARFVTLYRVSHGTLQEPLTADSGLDVPIKSRRFQKLFPQGLPAESAGGGSETVAVSVEELPFRRDGRRLLRIEGVLPNPPVCPSVVVLPALSVPGYKVVVRRGAKPHAGIQGITPFTIVLELPRWVKPAGRSPAPPR